MLRSLRKNLRLALALAFSSALTCVEAQTPSALAEWQFCGGVPLRAMFMPEIPKWDYDLGLAFIEQPKYEGSKDYVFQPGPTIDVRDRDVAFASTGEGIGWNIFHSKNYRAGLALTYDFGRRLNREKKSRGIGDDVQSAPEFKAFAEYVLVPFGKSVPLPIVLRADVRRAIGGYDGVVGDFSVYMPVYGGDKFFVLFGPSVTYANTPFMEQFFGVAQGQAQNFGVPEYEATGGFKSFAVGSNAIWTITDHWRLDITAAWTRLIGDAANSPTTERRNQYAFSLSLDYAWSRP